MKPLIALMVAVITALTVRYASKTTDRSIQMSNQILSKTQQEAAEAAEDFSGSWTSFGGGAENRRLAPEQPFNSYALSWMHPGRTGISQTVISGGSLFFGTYSGKIEELRLADGKSMQTFSMQNDVPVNPPLISGNILYASDRGGTLAAFDMSAPQKGRLWQRTMQSECLGFMNTFVRKKSGRRMLIFPSSDNFVTVSECINGKTVMTIPPGGSVMPAIISDAQDRYGIIAAYEGTLRIIDLQNSEKLRTVSIGETLGVLPAVSGEQIFLCDTSGNLRIAGIHSGKVERTVNLGENFFPSGSPAVSGKFIACPGENGEVVLLDRTTGKILKRIEFFGRPGTPLFLGDSKMLISSSIGMIYLMTLPDMEVIWKTDTARDLNDSLIPFANGFIISDMDGNIFCFTGKNSKQNN